MVDIMGSDPIPFTVGKHRKVVTVEKGKTFSCCNCNSDADSREELKKIPCNKTLPEKERRMSSRWQVAT